MAFFFFHFEKTALKYIYEVVLYRFAWSDFFLFFFLTTDGYNRSEEDQLLTMIQIQGQNDKIENTLLVVLDTFGYPSARHRPSFGYRL